jgi:DUF4097 and DUF4098 domain-containing protein YvlB
MKSMTSTGRAAALFAAVTFSLSAAPSVIKKEFNVKPGGNLVVHADRGNITIKTADISTVQVTIERELKGASSEAQEKLLQDYNLILSQDGDDVTVKASRPSRKWSLRDPLNKLQVRYNIVVPTKFNADVHTAGGNVAVGDLEGNLKAGTSGGNIDLDSIRGPVSASTSGGNVKLQGSKGNASLHTSGGNIRAGSIEGNLVAKTSGGDIQVENVTGAVEAKTSGGNIRLAEAGGPIMAHTSGGNVAASLTKQPKGDSVLKTSGGNVQLDVPENIALNVEGETSGGSVSSDFPAQINKSRTKLSASLSGGGPAMALSTSGGDVRLRKK